MQQNPDGGSWLHGEAYGEWKVQFHLGRRRLVLEGPVTAYAQAFEHRSPVGLMWYFPQGPSVPIEHLPAAMDALRAYVAEQEPRVFNIRVEPFVTDTPEHREILTAAGLIADVPHQINTSTVLVDLRPEPEAIFAGFRKNLRNHIRSAERSGYRVEQVPAEEATYRTMHRLLATVAGGGGTGVHGPYAHYRGLWEGLARRGQGTFWFGFDGAHDGPQAASFVIRYGTTAIAKDGGSVPDRAIRGGAALIRWTAMLDAKEHGASVWDAYATPHSSRADDPEHPYHRLGVFKRGFGPIVDHVPAHDLPIAPIRREVFHRLVVPVVRRVRNQPSGIWTTRLL